MSEKTPEDILKDRLQNIAINKPDYTFNMTIAAMQAYADQEKRSTAIAFHIWLDKNSVPLYSGLTIEQMYDLYLQSLSKTD